MYSIRFEPLKLTVQRMLHTFERDCDIIEARKIWG